jgi:protein-tyrosine phosphatase
MGDKVSIVFVCLGNICRSPLAEGVFRHKVEEAGLAARFEIDSSGTSSYHVGEGPDPGSVKVARQHGMDISRQRSRQFKRQDLTDFDLIIAMDSSNLRNILNMADDLESVRGRVWLMRNFEFEQDGSGHDEAVPDPWGGGARGFDTVYEIVDRASTNLLAHIRETQGL